MKNDKEIQQLFASLAQDQNPDQMVCAKVAATLVRFSRPVCAAFEEHLSFWSESTVRAVTQHYADIFSQHEGDTYLLAGWLYFNYQLQTWPKQPNGMALSWVYHMSQRVAHLFSESLKRAGEPLNYARLHGDLCKQFNMTVDFIPPTIVPNQLSLQLAVLQHFIPGIFECFHDAVSKSQFPCWFPHWQNFELKYIKKMKGPVHVYVKDITVQPDKTGIYDNKTFQDVMSINRWSLLYTVVSEHIKDEIQRQDLIQTRDELSSKTLSATQKLIQADTNVQTKGLLPKDVWSACILSRLLPEDRARVGATCHLMHALNREFNQFRWEFPVLFAQHLALNSPINPRAELKNARAIAYDPSTPDVEKFFAALAEENVADVVVSHKLLSSNRQRPERVLDADLMTLALTRDNLALCLFVLAHHQHKNFSAREMLMLAAHHGASTILKLIGSVEDLRSLKIRLMDLEECLNIACQKRHYRAIAVLMDAVHFRRHYRLGGQKIDPSISFEDRIFGPNGSLILISMQRYSEFREACDVYHLVTTCDLDLLLRISESTLQALGRTKLKYQAMYWGILHGEVYILKELKRNGVTLESFSNEEQSVLLQTLITALHAFARELSCTDHHLDLNKVIKKFDESQQWADSLEEICMHRAMRVSQYLTIVKMYLPKIIEILNTQEPLVRLVVDSDNQEFIECMRAGVPAIDELAKSAKSKPHVSSDEDKNIRMRTSLEVKSELLNALRLFLFEYGQCPPAEREVEIRSRFSRDVTEQWTFTFSELVSELKRDETRATTNQFPIIQTLSLEQPETLLSLLIALEFSDESILSVLGNSKVILSAFMKFGTAKRCSETVRALSVIGQYQRWSLLRLLMEKCYLSEKNSPYLLKAQTSLATKLGNPSECGEEPSHRFLSSDMADVIVSQSISPIALEEHLHFACARGSLAAVQLIAHTGFIERLSQDQLAAILLSASEREEPEILVALRQRSAFQVASVFARTLKVLVPQGRTANVIRLLKVCPDELGDGVIMHDRYVIDDLCLLAKTNDMLEVLFRFCLSNRSVSCRSLSSIPEEDDCRQLLRVLTNPELRQRIYFRYEKLEAEIPKMNSDHHNVILVESSPPSSKDFDPRLHPAMHVLNEIELYIVSKTLKGWNLGGKQSRFTITINGVDYKVPQTIAKIYRHIESAPCDGISSLEPTYRAISACMVEKDKFRIFPQLRKEETTKSYQDIATLLAKRFRSEDTAPTLLERTQCLEKLYSLNGKPSSHSTQKINNSNFNTL